jgi:putative two-component system response regulator
MSKLANEIQNKDLLDVIQRMALLAEYREKHIEKHLERMKGYCLILAHACGFTTQEAESIAYASLLHDIGEIAIEDSLLQKAGKLSPYELDKIKRHPAIGSEILHGSSSRILQTAETIAYTHHERWDGSGYPQGLAGENIPIIGRICALADVFDALTTYRPYKEEIPVEEALGLIEAASGQLFDPALVVLFRANFDKIVQVHQNHR